MAISLKHLFTSAKPDSSDPTLINPSNWNDEHELLVGASSLIGNPSSSEDNAIEIPLGEGLSFSAGALINGVFKPFGPATLNNQTGTAETSIARWDIPADYLTEDMAFAITFAGQVSSTSTLTFRLRIGPTGTNADALLINFGTSGAGVANQHIQGNIMTFVLSPTTMSGSGFINQGAANLAQASGVFAPATFDPTVLNKLSLNLSQSAAQTYTSRFAVLNRVS